jgi:synaptic vesicle membrane protein VAT-1
MRVAEIARFGGPDVFRIVERPSRPLLAGEVRIKVSASGINFADIQMRMGLYPEAPRVPFVPGFEAAGVIAETAPDVTGFHIGERVLALSRFGAYADELVLPAFQVRPTPRRLSDVEAAAIPVAFMTAWIALYEMGRVREEDLVLVPGAAGGVGSAAVQLAARAGARVVGVVGSAAKKDAVRGLGAEKVFTYEELAAVPAEREYTFILEARGGKQLRESLRRLAPGGRVLSYGVSSIVKGPRRSLIRALAGIAQSPLFTPIGLAMGNTGVFGVNLLKFFESDIGTALLIRALDGVLDAFAEGKLKAMVGKVFPLDQAGKAHAYLQSRKSIGKVVLSSIKDFN